MRHGLVVTPATQWGSWTWIAEVLEDSPSDMHWTVVGYGKPAKPIPGVTFVSLPALQYGTVGITMSKKRWLFLNLLYMAPLVPVAWAIALYRRPRVLAGNGFVSTAILLPVKFIVGGKLVLLFHAYTKNMGKAWDVVLRFVAHSCDHIFVVSTTAVEDLGRLVDPGSLVQVPHWAAPAFFAVPLERPRNHPIRLLFVGRMEREKFAQCLAVAKEVVRTGEVEFWAVGEGSLVQEFVDVPGAKHFGYITDRAELAKVYAQADVLWSAADVTYLSRPGIDALASGVPVIVGNVPAQETRLDSDERIPKSLVPEGVGWVVDGRDNTEAVELLRKLNATGISLEMRQACRKFASEHHSDANRALVTDTFR